MQIELIYCRAISSMQQEKRYLRLLITNRSGDKPGWNLLSFYHYFLYFWLPDYTTP